MLRSAMPSPMLTFLLGGARSGKSTLAVELAAAHRRRCHRIVATQTAGSTATPTSTGASPRHRAERPATWPTIEEPLDLVGALARAADVVRDRRLPDAVGVQPAVPGRRRRRIDGRRRETATAAAAATAPTVVVTNEVGLGVHPDDRARARYRDVLGRVNQLWAAAADTSLLLVAGRALPLDDPRLLA